MVYLDNNATTPIDPQVVEAMLPYLHTHYGNPSCSHNFGEQANKGVLHARRQVADFFGCTPAEVVFTGCATEANNTILKGIAYRYRKHGKHIITTAIEHPSILDTCRYLAANGCEISYLPVDKDGLVDPEQFRQTLREDTILASIMHANNEVGTIQPVAELAAIAREHKVLFHTDASQSVGKVPTRIDELGVDLLTLAGHKFYAPKGVGAFIIRQGIDIEPLLHGGSQENGRRSGTENVALVVALGEACAIASATMSQYVPQMRYLRDLLVTTLQDGFPSLVRNGHGKKCLPNTANVAFPGLKAPEILARAPEIAVSVGSACHGDSMSPVLAAMQVPLEVAQGTIRFSLGKFNSEEQVVAACEQVLAVVRDI